MAKKKVEETNDNFAQVTSLIKKDYGNVVISGDALFSRKRKIIPVTPSLDHAFGGGIPEGSWVVVTGPEKFGKTTLLLQAAQNAQKDEYGGKHIIYLDAEARLKEMNFYSFKFNKEKFHHIISERGKNPLTAEDFLNIAISYLKQYPECFMIIDSVSALCERREREGGVGTETRGGGAKLVAQFIRDMAQVVSVNDSIICLVTHMMANTSGKGHLTIIEKTANELKYQVDVKLRALSKEIIFPNADKDTKAIGQKINWLVEYNALGMSPNQKVECFLRYGQGLDEIYDWIEFGIALGLITVAEGGGWHTINFCDGQKVQGRENLRQFFVENENSLNDLRSKVKELIS